MITCSKEEEVYKDAFWKETKRCEGPESREFASRGLEGQYQLSDMFPRIKDVTKVVKTSEILRKGSMEGKGEKLRHARAAGPWRSHLQHLR